MATLAQPPAILPLLAHAVRWQIVTALARSDRRGQELAQLLARPQNLISYHLKRLTAGAVVREQRSAADGRDVYYSLDLNQVRQLYSEGGEAIHPALAEPSAALGPAEAGSPPVRVLFLCTGNSARSQMAEAILRHLSKGQVEAYSAGTAPSQINPAALATMQARGISMEGQRSKHLDEYRGQKFDYVVTVCDRARESCPIFPGNPEQIHWSFPDPAAVVEPRAKRQAYERTATELTTRINHLVLLINRQRAEGPAPRRGKKPG
jgi:ArsR family transcriptional regulator, arsenate/arsenite/antimonite-responsive transcriptional repressor / arsenate reductase (thioredoxin)